MSEREGIIYYTCERCGLTDSSVRNTQVYMGCSSSSPRAFYEMKPLHPQCEDGERDTCLDAMRERLTTAERERDEARRERDLLRTAMVWAMGDYPSDAVDAATEYVKKAEALRDRAVRAERVVEAAKAWVGDDVDAGYKLWEAVRALDAAEGSNA